MCPLSARVQDSHRQGHQWGLLISLQNNLFRIKRALSHWKEMLLISGIQRAHQTSWGINLQLRAADLLKVHNQEFQVDQLLNLYPLPLRISRSCIKIWAKYSTQAHLLNWIESQARSIFRVWTQVDLTPNKELTLRILKVLNKFRILMQIYQVLSPFQIWIHFRTLTSILQFQLRLW